MDWAKKEVASLELNKKLKELGFPQEEPGWFWCLRKDSEFYDLFFTMDKMYFYKPKQYEEFFIEYYHLQDYIKAYTCSELSEWLIEKFIFIKLGRLYIEYDETVDKWVVCYGKVGKEWVWDDVKVNAYAKMVIWLRENGYITFNQGG